MNHLSLGPQQFTTAIATFSEICKIIYFHLRCTTRGNETGGKFTTGIADNSRKFTTGSADNNRKFTAVVKNS
jgi:hypothetical protein